MRSLGAVRAARGRGGIRRCYDGPSALKPLQKAAGFAPACVMAAAAISNARRRGGGNRVAHARGAQAARLVVFAAA